MGSSFFTSCAEDEVVVSVDATVVAAGFVSVLDALESATGFGQRSGVHTFAR